MYWLNPIQIPDVPNTGSGFIVLQPWYQKPRLQMTLLLTILAGLLFSSLLGALGSVAEENRHGIVGEGHPVGQTARKTTTSVAALAGIELALVTWLQL